MGIGSYIIISITVILIVLGAYIIGTLNGEKKGKKILIECKKLINDVLYLIPPDKYEELSKYVQDFYDNIERDDND